MKKATSLNEQIDRILSVSNYKIQESKRTLVEMVTPIGEVAPVAPQQAQQTTQQPNQNDAAVEREIDTALNQIIQTLPQELQQIAKTQGDRDGQLEPVGHQQQAPAGQQQAPVGQQAQPAQVAEQELDEAILATIAGGALAAPAIANLVGKAASFLGKKLDNQTIQNLGQKVSHMADHLHHKYIGAIEKMISPLTQSATPETRHKIAMGIFYALVAALGGAGAMGATSAAQSGNVGLAAVETGLTGVKASELISAARGIITKILSNVVA